MVYYSHHNLPAQQHTLGKVNLLYTFQTPCPPLKERRFVPVRKTVRNVRSFHYMTQLGRSIHFGMLVFMIKYVQDPAEKPDDF
jgi:hypothetical protein